MASTSGLTFGGLTDQIHSLLHSTTGIQEQMTWLTTAALATDLSLAVNDGDQVSRGICEVGDELVYVNLSDANTVSLAPFGRGYRGTTAAAHDINTPVTFNPAFARAEIKRAINACLQQVYPSLYAIKTTTFTFSGSVLTYALPADCEAVVKVIWQTIGPSGYWETSYGWQFEPNSELVGGKAITLVDPPEQGRTVKVVYQSRFDLLVADTDTLTTIKFPESAADVLLYGVASKLIRFLDTSRLQLDSAENVSRAQVVAAGDAGKIANQFYAMYQQRLGEERNSLLSLNPPQIHYTR